MEGRAREIHGLYARSGRAKSIRSVASALPFRTELARAPNTLDTLLSPTIQSCTERNESCVNFAVILRTRNRGGLRAILFSGISHLCRWKTADQFFQAKRIHIRSKTLSSPSESNRIEINVDSFSVGNSNSCHDPIFFESLLFSFLFQPRVSSIKLDGGSNKKRPRAKVCLEPVRGRSLAISPWREFLTRGRWQQATGSPVKIYTRPGK